MANKNKIPWLLMAFVFSSCSLGDPDPKTDSSSNTISQNSPSSSIKDAEDDYQDNNGDFTIKSSSGSGYEIQGNDYIILQEGEYTFQGTTESSQIIVRAPEQKVTIRLEGVTMKSISRSLVNIEEADKVTIKAIDGTYNELKDIRSSSSDTSVTDAAAIYSEADLDMGGSGSLVVSSTFNNGIHSKKDLAIKKLTLKVDAINNALKGNDSVSIESGNLVIISRAGNGVKTSNSNITSKGNQKGDITISGGNIEVYSSQDALDAANDFQMENLENPQIKIFTDKYSSYSDDLLVADKNMMYLRVTGSSLSSEYRYAACFYNSDEDYVWKNATYYKTLTGNRGNSYFIYRLEVPANYANVQWYRFLSSQNENSFSTYESKSEGGTINVNKDMYVISNDTNRKITGNWSSYDQTVSSGSSTNKSDHSAKGIKASNEINIKGGQITIEANDDGLHANGGTVLENGNTGLGNITITGGNLNIISTDDGIHADSIATFDGEVEVTIQESYEGIEAQQLYFKNGNFHVTASDDGINACSGSLSTLIEVSGGYLDVTVGSGDTDAIDSNGDYRQTGGFVVARCGASTQGGMMSALDLDGSFYMTGGTFIGAGSIGASLNSLGVNSVQFGGSSSRPGGGSGGPGGWWAYGSSSYSFTSGNYTISNTTIAFTLNQTYSQLAICSDELLLNGSYTISNGNVNYSWIQDSVYKSLS